jgi:aspartyl-tRNA(Asn)/glutamyl-tRNA(Gln) amidotransferase subunit A
VFFATFVVSLRGASVFRCAFFFFCAIVTIDEFGRQLRARKITARAFTEQCLQRITELQPHLNAFIRVMADEARRDADAADGELAAGRHRGPLHGVPIAIKDLIDIRGIPTTAASRVREGHVASADAPVITRLRNAGAVLIGKTNLDEFAFGTTSENSAFGLVRNPIDPERSPGGSSGGSAVAVATGMALAALGTDTGGSIRIPAAACGIAGLKPTIGEISTEAVVPLSRTLDHLGPLAQTVRDATIVYRVLAGLQRPGPLSDERGTDPHRRAVDLARSAKLGIPRGYLTDLLDADVRGRFDETVAALRGAGALITDVSVPHAAMTPAVYIHIHSSEGATYHAMTLDTSAERYTPVVRRRLEVGRYVLAQDYVRAMEGRETLRGEVDTALADCDALILPTLPIVAPPIGAETVTVNAKDEPVRALMLRLTQLFNVTGHPAVSIPCGVTSQGLPAGLQVVGRRGQTEALLAYAVACEETITSSRDRQPR